MDTQEALVLIRNRQYQPKNTALTGGVPRQVNNVATACLINAAARGLKIITEALVNETMAEFALP